MYISRQKERKEKRRWTGGGGGRGEGGREGEKQVRDGSERKRGRQITASAKKREVGAE